VTNRAGTEHVGDLTVDQFRLFEDGVEQDITAFSRERRPISLVIALDSSGSMKTNRKLAESAVTRVIRGLEPDDEVAVLVFADHAEVPIPWTRVAVFPPIDWDGWRPESSTALYDGLRQALDLIAVARNPRAAILIVSDGYDNASKLKFEQIVRTKRQSETTVYAFQIGADSLGPAPLPQVTATQPSVSTVPSALPSLLSSPSSVFHGLVDDSGGRLYAVRDTSEAERSPIALLDELRSQYLLGYTPRKPFDGKYRKVKATTRDGRLEVRHRAGYLARPEPAARPR
jgi:VWFA-related protein